MLSRAAFILFAAACCAAAQTSVPLQPLAQQVRRLEDAMNYLGQPFPAADRTAINAAIANTDEGAAVAGLEKILDRFALAVVDINAESRVKVDPGPAKPELVEGGTRLFLVKVINRAGVTAPLRVASPNSGNVYIQSTGNPEPKMELTKKDAAGRWAEISIYDKPPMNRRLSGLALDYRILQVYSRDSGERSAQISFNVGQGSQDIGFRNDILVLFNALPARTIRLHVRDEKGQPAMASFIIRDRLNRLYPNPSKRLAPDFFFQPQIYRADGESISLPAGYYNITYSGGPEYRTHTKEFAVDDKGPGELSFQLERWIDPARYGWYSGDHHVHAAGCSHYQNPTEGVLPQDMVRQISGERLNVGSVLTWGPDYYYQKQFFSGHDDPLSKPDELMHYDLEVSGFPSSHAGHLVLLGLREQDYPGAARISGWPTWDLPILRWAKSQGAVAGFAHSGWGLEVMSDDLPNYEMPGFDGIGANEYIVDVTQPGLVDFISAVDTPYVWELSIWYHTLNVGFRTRIGGETDFPCIYDRRVGMGRTYAKLDNLTYANWIAALKAGRSYVSDGKSHLMDFQVNGTQVGTGASEVQLSAAATVHAQVRVAAYLDPLPDQSIRGKPYNEQPYWDVERARIGDTREVPVELVVNGQAVARKNVLADGQVRDVAFDAAIEKSSWVAVRILPSSHTNPIFVLVGGKPVRASRRSAEWCLAAVDQCWTQKAPRISVAELGAARQAYDHAREVYRKLISESQ
ncbi:MAG TPA: CehA/McbA family metallohydrolase [Bryobacteraceae bacterium]|nr:CehA/McbA family metallohydrolase [Bryobacteraceae bacterium]